MWQLVLYTMEDGIERSMSFLIEELEKKQRIVTMPKYEEQVHPIGLSLIGRQTTPIGRSETMPISHHTTPISRETTPISRETTPISRETTPISNHTTPIGCAQTLVKTTPNLPSTNTGSDS